MSERDILSVNDITARIKTVLEGNLPSVWVRGEVSQFTRHRSGHWYFALTDDRSTLPCVCWRGRADMMTFQPKVGQSILVQGKVTVYERGGRYQFDSFEIRPAGIGELAMAFEELKRKLNAEGLFDFDRKKALPSLPEKIGLVTSPDGAALHDILRVAKERAPWIEFRFAPVAVQGLTAGAEIAAGIKELDSQNWADIIIIGRGGGSPEDLWAFNEERVVRAIAACQTPLVSAVGHEVDVTLSDLTADVRAPTPSAAAEICLPDQEAIRDRLTEFRGRLVRVVKAMINERQNWIRDYAERVLNQQLPAIWREESQRIDELSRRIEIASARSVERKSAIFDQLIARHRSLDPLAILSRGYSVVRKSDDVQPVTSSDELVIDDSINITFHRGSAEATIRNCQN